MIIIIIIHDLFMIISRFQNHPSWITYRQTSKARGQHLIVSELLDKLESSRVKVDMFLAKSYSLWFSGLVSSHALTPMTNKEEKKYRGLSQTHKLHKTTQP